MDGSSAGGIDGELDVQAVTGISLSADVKKFVAAFCEKEEACASHGRRFSDRADCYRGFVTEHECQGALATLEVPGIDDCIATIEEQSCGEHRYLTYDTDQFNCGPLQLALVNAGWKRRTLEGGACTDSDGSGCISGLKCTGDDKSCGMCVQPKRVGEECSGWVDCPAGSFCDEETSKCKAYGLEGDACAVDDECLASGIIGSECQGGKCHFNQLGDPCDGDCGNYLDCRDGKCVSRALAGQTCSIDSEDVNCTRSNRCSDDGMCTGVPACGDMERAAEGESCQDMQCEGGLVCPEFGGTTCVTLEEFCQE